jgi:hypothetical protein
MLAYSTLQRKWKEAAVGFVMVVFQLFPEGRE